MSSILSKLINLAGNITGTLPAVNGGLATDASAFTGVVKASTGAFSAATIVNADVSGSAAIDGSKLVAASASVAGAVTTGTQTFAGAKTFTSNATIQGNVSGTAVSAGFIGELTPGGTQRSGTNGYTYSVRSTTTTTTTPAAIVSLTLNKGIYIVTYKGRLASASGTVNFLGFLRIGGTQVEVQSTAATATTAQFGTIGNTIPVFITADSIAVDLFASIDTSTSSSNSHEMWAVRIA